MATEFFPVYNKHGREIVPSRHRKPLAWRMAEAILRELEDVSQPTIHRDVYTQHVSCYETGATVIVTEFPPLPPRRSLVGEMVLPRVRLEVGWEITPDDPTYDAIRLRSLVELGTDEAARAMVLGFLSHCRPIDSSDTVERRAAQAALRRRSAEADERELLMEQAEYLARKEQAERGRRGAKRHWGTKQGKQRQMSFVGGEV